jgi:hypothetical protein
LDDLNGPQGLVSSMHLIPVDTIGWAATALFTASYFFKRAAALRRVQILAALLWVGYGALVGAVPVVAANVVCAALAAGWTERSPGGPGAEASGTA